MNTKINLIYTATVAAALGLSTVAWAEEDIVRHPYFGQTHQHTGWSFDANIFNVQLGPENAFKHARGDKVNHPWGYFAKLKVPLDFMVVTDHGEYLGVIKKMNEPGNPVSLHPLAKLVRASGSDVEASTKAFYGLVASAAQGGELKPRPELNTKKMRKTNWEEMIAIVDQYNNPGTFTTLAGFEWSSQPYGMNLHRNIIFKGTANLPLPFTYFDSGDPQELWKWMDETREGGVDLLAIPHNSNLSQGLMFPDVVLGSLEGDSLQPESERANIDSDYAEARMRNERLVEIVQTKGQSETHPVMSPYDEFADFEIWTKPTAGPGSVDPSSPNNYVREAFKRGMQYKKTLGINPFKYGIVGGGDIHTSIVSHEEYAHSGEHNLKSSTPTQRLLESQPSEPSKIEQGSAGLSCVWADANTRDAIYEAMDRRETWGTSGPRIKVRLFGGYGFTQAMFERVDWAIHGYAKGVPMGGDLATPMPVTAESKLLGGVPQTSITMQKPVFMIKAEKGPHSGNLDRIQMIKGWVDADGKTHERIYNVVWSNKPVKRELSGDIVVTTSTVGETGETTLTYDTLPAIGTDHVDIGEASYDNSLAGSNSLEVLWTDEEFDPTVPSFYYLRVLEIPTPRWSTYDAAVLGITPPSDFPSTIQERAWTSPIWYTPKPTLKSPARKKS